MKLFLILTFLLSIVYLTLTPPEPPTWFSKLEGTKKTFQRAAYEDSSPSEEPGPSESSASESAVASNPPVKNPVGKPEPSPSWKECLENAWDSWDQWIAESEPVRWITSQIHTTQQESSYLYIKNPLTDRYRTSDPLGHAYFDLEFRDLEQLSPLVLELRSSGQFYLGDKKISPQNSHLLRYFNFHDPINWQGQDKTVLFLHHELRNQLIQLEKEEGIEKGDPEGVVIRFYPTGSNQFKIDREKNKTSPDYRLIISL